LSGDKVWYLGYLISLLIVLQILFLKADNKVDLALLASILSLTFNDLFDELFGNPHKVEVFEVVVYGLVAFGFCRTLKLKWYWMLLIIGAVIGLGLI